MIWHLESTFFLTSHFLHPMADSRPGLSTADEKLDAITVTVVQKRKGFFSRKKPPTTIRTTIDDNIDEKGGNITTEVKPTAPEIPSVSFTQLFRSVEFLLCQCLLDSVLILKSDTPQNLSSLSMLLVYLLLQLQGQLWCVQISLVQRKC